MLFVTLMRVTQERLWTVPFRREIRIQLLKRWRFVVMQLVVTKVIFMLELNIHQRLQKLGRAINKAYELGLLGKIFLVRVLTSI